MIYLSSIRRRAHGDSEFPWSVPVVAALEVLELRAPVTFFVGENGSGKSTLLEGIAAGLRAVAMGSDDIDRDETLRAARRLGEGLQFERRHRPATTLFFRAEDVFGFTRRMMRSIRDLAETEEAFRQEFAEGSYGQRLAMGAARGQRAALEARYGADPDARSHGEVFLALLASRMTPRGLYLLDEPEAPLSPRGILQLIALLKDRVGQECQFLIATHSPILLALPDASIYVFEGSRITETPYDDVDHVRIAKSFLNNPQQFLKHL